MFLQAVILNTDTGALSVYDPLVIDSGTQPAAPLVTPVLPVHYVVGIFGGGNDDATVLIGAGKDNCVSGIGNRRFGQVFFCGTQALFHKFDSMHKPVPTIGYSNTGELCPTVRSFQIVDQDQSDNVQTTYLAKDGLIAQNNAANRKLLGNFTVLNNGSDNTLLTKFVDPAISCTPWLLVDQAGDNLPVPTQFSDEEQALHYQVSPVALVPIGDPMTGTIPMTNAFRVSVNQKRICNGQGCDNGNTVTYCSNLKNTAPSFFIEHQRDFTGKPSPQKGTDLQTFLVNRYNTSLTLLNC